MPTLQENAKAGIITDLMTKVAIDEGVNPERLRQLIAEGKVVIPQNRLRTLANPRAIGQEMSTKVNVNIGTSPYHMDIEEEMQKMAIAVEYGTDSIMDLSLGAVINEVRKKILEKSPVMVGTVPIYQMMYELARQKKDVLSFQISDFLKVVEKQAKEGVDFMTIHAGLTAKTVDFMEYQGREMRVVSRGGSVLASFIKKNNLENPLYQYYDEILDILYEYDITISLGDGMRPGALVDNTDRAQLGELLVLGELTQRAWDRGIQVMVEGPGHVSLNNVALNMKVQKNICQGAPFYILGPLVTDIATGHDHLAGAIGGALAAYNGADFLCYLTPAEHLRLPTVDDVREGVIASKIAAQAADVALGLPKAWEKERQMAVARKNLDWEKQIGLCIDAKKAQRFRQESEIGSDEFCTMCGEFCSVKRMQDFFD